MDRRFGYTIYKNPKDQPGQYVVRGWDIEDGDVVMADDAITMPISDKALDTLRETLIESGLYCIGRQPFDDPVIVESWV
jgi:hypothetical protein